MSSTAASPARTSSEVVHRARREQIAGSAAELYAARGTLDVPVEDIAAAAHVSRSTVYNHFRDRDEILATALEMGHRRHRRNLTAALADCTDPVDRLITVFRVTLELLASDGLARLVFSETRTNSDPTLTAEVELVTAEANDLMTSICAAAVDAGRLRSDIALHRLVRFVRQQMGGLVAARSRRPSDRPPQAEAEEIVQLLVAGLGPARAEQEQS